MVSITFLLLAESNTSNGHRFQLPTPSSCFLQNPCLWAKKLSSLHQIKIVATWTPCLVWFWWRFPCFHTDFRSTIYNSQVFFLWPPLSTPQQGRRRGARPSFLQQAVRWHRRTIKLTRATEGQKESRTPAVLQSKPMLLVFSVFVSTNDQVGCLYLRIMIGHVLYR